jgi:type II secretory pathway component PulJ
MAHDRAWRSLASHPISPRLFKTTAWPEATAALTPDASSPSAEANSAPEPNRDRAGLPAAMMVMIAVNFGAVLGLVGWPALQAMGVVNEPVIDTVQRNQAELISRLDSTVTALNATVADLGARVASTGDKQEAASQFMAEIDARFVALRRSMRELRDAQNAVNESWLAPVAELNAAATKARGDIVKLRAALDELSRLRHPEAAAISARLDRTEQAIAQTRLPGAIRGSIPASAERPRSIASVASAERAAAADGHLFDLKPVQ